MRRLLVVDRSNLCRPHVLARVVMLQRDRVDVEPPIPLLVRPHAGRHVAGNPDIQQLAPTPEVVQGVFAVRLVGGWGVRVVQGPGGRLGLLPPVQRFGLRTACTPLTRELHSTQEGEHKASPEA